MRSAPHAAEIRVLVAGLLGAFLAGSLGAQAGSVCRIGESRALDFLLGDWRLVAGDDNIGVSKVDSLEDGCLIRETWTLDDGRSGRTWNTWDRAANVWRRFTVSNDGSVVRAAGSADGGEVVFEGEHVSAGGTASVWRERLRQAGGEVEWLAGTSPGAQVAERPRDVMFEALWVPEGMPASTPSRTTSRPVANEPAVTEPAREPLAPEAPAEPASTVDLSTPQASGARTAPTAGEVTPGSARAENASLIERVAMESPMVLRLPLGPVETLPEGYAWITRDTAPYLCEGVTIRSIRVGRRVRRRQVELAVDLRLHTELVSRRVEIAVDLYRAGSLDGSEPAASGSVTGLVGRVVPEQIEHGEVTIDATLAMDEDLFAELVAGRERPVLAVSLTVGG